jgi:phosphatidylglycerophosphate synthase
MKLINKKEILNTFIALLTIIFFLGILYFYVLMSSLKTFCSKDNLDKKSMNEGERVFIGIIISIIIILWYDDSRNWHQIGSILFILVTIFAFYCMFYYSVSHPSFATISMYFFVEWLILFFYRKENSKNAIHFSFMTV